MQVISVTFPKKIVVTVAVTAKHVVSADLTEILLDLDAINGEVIGTTAAEKTDKIEATKLAIETAVEAEGVTIPAITAFADYSDYVALIPSVVEAAYKSSVDAVNGEPSADLTAGIALTASTKLAIETAIEAAGGNVTALTVFADYPDKIAEVVAAMQYRCLFEVYPTDTACITRLSLLNSPEELTLPIELNGVTMTGVGRQALYGLRENAVPDAGYFGTLRRLIVPDNYYRFGYQAMLGSSIEHLRLPENPLFTVIPQQLCTVSLVEITIPPQIVQINTIAFQACPIIKIIIPANVAIADDGSMGAYGAGFRALYGGNGKLAGTYEYAAGTWSKTA